MSTKTSKDIPDFTTKASINVNENINVPITNAQIFYSYSFLLEVITLCTLPKFR